MSTSITLRRYLDRQDVRYATISCDNIAAVMQQGNSEIAADSIAKAIILKDLRGMAMAVIPGPRDLDLEALNRQMHRNLRPADVRDYRGIFADCSPDTLPPLGEAYGLETILDDSLSEKDLVYFVSGNPNELIRISGHDFQVLHSNAWYGNTFSRISSEPRSGMSAAPAARGEKKPAVSGKAMVKQRIQKITNMPPMPSMAQKIIQLNSNPYAHAEDLARLVEKDPSLSAQIIRYAQSSFYGYQGTITSVRQAISRVLGYDLVMNIALGIAATRPFKSAPQGPFGLQAHWRHATYNATLCQGLCNAIPSKQRPRAGTAYMCGLLHNFGFLVLGYLFPNEFIKLNNAIVEDPYSPVIELEQRLLGTNHAELGSWLMEAWNMPEEVHVTISQHHNFHYSGPHAEYVRLVNIANQLLKRHNIGDADSDELPEDLEEKTGLCDTQAIAILGKTFEGREDLDSMARQLAA